MQQALDHTTTGNSGQSAGADCQAAAPAAAVIHRLLAQAASQGTRLLLTSRQHPAGLAGEHLFPDPAHPLPGLADAPGAALFLHYCTKSYDPATRTLAHAVSQATGGHPLAITLLAGEYNTSDVAPADFLTHWDDELAEAQDYGQAAHHHTFVTALNRSYAALTPEQQRHLRALTRYGFPFFAEGAEMLWAATTDNRRPATNDGETVADTAQVLGDFVRRSLLEVDGWYTDEQGGQSPATYRFQPAVRQILARFVENDERAAQDAGYVAYGAWLAWRGFNEIHKSPSWARVVQLSLDALDAAANAETTTLQDTPYLWHIKYTAWIKGAYGQTQAAYDLLNAVLPSAGIPPTHPTPEATRTAQAT